MGNAKHGGLTGAFYGPPVPPRHTSRSIGRGSSCCCGCLFCALLQILVSVIVIIGIIVLALWLVFRPNKLKVYVDNASLTRFDLSTANSLNFNLSLDVSIRNPNKRVAIYYDSVEAISSYDGYRFGYDNSLPVFFQDHKNTTVIHPMFGGQQALAVASTADTYRREKGDGWFYVEVKIYTRVRFKVWFIKTNKYTPKFTCNLKLPVPSATGSGAFSQTTCDVDLF